MLDSRLKTSRRRALRGAALVATMTATAAVAACSKSGDQRSASGGLDAAILATGSVSPAAGPAVQVTRTDSKSVDKAMKYELTTQNFSEFKAAADSIDALVQRDSTARAYLANNLTDAGSTDADAGLRWLEASPTVTAAIESAGISVRDYFVQAIAIAAAQRFIDDPKAAPPTPTLAKNARFLADHRTDLERLALLRANTPVVITTP